MPKMFNDVVVHLYCSCFSEKIYVLYDIELKESKDLEYSKCPKISYTLF